MYPIILSVGRLNIYSHGLMIVIGALIGGLIVFYLAKKNNLNTKILFDLIVYSLLGGLITARLTYALLYWHQFTSIKEVFYIWYGGLVSFGGMIGGFLVAILILVRRKLPVPQWLDISIGGFFIGWAFGRIGCLLNGDSLGLISSSRVAIWERIPTQLFESIWSLLIGLFCVFLILKKSKIRLPEGLVFLIGLGGYCLGRFVIDFFKDEEAILLHLKGGQLFSILVLLVVIAISFFKIKRAKLERQNGNS